MTDPLSYSTFPAILELLYPATHWDTSTNPPRQIVEMDPDAHRWIVNNLSEAERFLGEGIGVIGKLMANTEKSALADRDWYLVGDIIATLGETIAVLGRDYACLVGAEPIAKATEAGK